eukprot:TRINITY_DN3258_c0_g1_i6.p1 TRINITY_DN3258_c0_g1~~TRINITY_DN3258_c0_g1_i6.p1  ORF type:complete len:387 (+),score=92.96 TRINITY_DN3258_c0_g1_i6:214-1374(+)
MHATHFFGGRYQSHHEMEEDEVKEKDLFDQYVDIHLKALDDLMRVNEKSAEMIERVVAMMESMMKSEKSQLAIARFLATIPPKELFPYLMKEIEEREGAEEKNTKAEQKQEPNKIYELAIELAEKRQDNEMIESLWKSKEGLTQGGDSYMSKECVEVLLSCLFDVKSEWCWTEIIEIFGEEGMREEHHPQVISALRHKLQVLDTEETSETEEIYNTEETSDTEETFDTDEYDSEEYESHRGRWNGEIILSMIKLGVKEDWMLDRIISNLQQLIGGGVRYDNRKLTLLQCLSLLGKWNDEAMKIVVSILKNHKEYEGPDPYYPPTDFLQVLLEATKLVETLADQNDETADHVLVELLKHWNEEIRVVAGRILGIRQIHQRDASDATI